MRLIFPVVILSLSAFACNRQAEVTNPEILVKVGNHTLLKSDLDNQIPEGLNKEDSILVAENYIRSWVKDNLLYDIASKNITNKEELNLLVENYKRSLTIHKYQEQLVRENLSSHISREEEVQYFEANPDKFKLDRILIKGLYLKVPIGASDMNKLREWYRSLTPANLEKIEKYSIQNAVFINYFDDQWADFNDLSDNLPIQSASPEAFVRQNKFVEVQDSSFYYFLNIKEVLYPGDNAPFEYAQPTIKEILVNQKKLDFLRRMENDLYNSALEKGRIKFRKE